MRIVPKSKEVKLEDLNETLMKTSEELENISAELSELNSGLSTIGTILTIHIMVSSKPELKDKGSPLINELIKGLDMTISQIR